MSYASNQNMQGPGNVPPASTRASRGPKIAIGAVGGLLAICLLVLGFDVNGLRSNDLARYRLASQYGREDGAVTFDLLRQTRFQWQRSATSLRLSRGLSHACQASFGLRVYWNGPVPRQQDHRIEVQIPAGSNAEVRSNAVVRIDGTPVPAEGSGAFLEWPLPQPDNLGTAEVRFELSDETDPDAPYHLGFIRADGCGLQIIRRQKGG